MRPSCTIALLSVIGTAVPSASVAQWREARAWSPETQSALEPPPSPVAPTLLSLALPGAGQHVLGQNRKWVYLALELAGWALWAERRAAAHDYRDRYRDYAWEAARVQSAPRVDGDFDYYERMTKWSRSGAFDTDPISSGVQPELDPGSYNGSIWSLAAQIHFPPGPPPPPPDPAYQDALAYYQRRAYASALLWDWSGASGGQQELALLIEESDSRFGQATTVLGAVIANHVLSAADAFLSARGRSGAARLRVMPGLGWAWPGVGPSDAGAAIGAAQGGGRVFGQPGADWLLVLSVGVGR